MNILIEQEKALHKHAVRTCLADIQRLIHPDFVEIGRSGATYNFRDMVESMAAEAPPHGHLYAQDFQCRQLEPAVQLVLYKSVWLNDDGSKTSFAKRASIWVFTGERWQLKFHQGTPCPAFALRT